MPKFIKLTKIDSQETYFLNVLHILKFSEREEGGSYIETAEEWHPVQESPSEILALIEKPLNHTRPWN